MDINGIRVISASIISGYGIYLQTDKLIKKIFESTILRCDSLFVNPVALTVTITVCAMTSLKIQLGIFITLFMLNLSYDFIKVLSVELKDIKKMSSTKTNDMPSFLTCYTGTNELMNKHDDILKEIRIHLHQESVGHIVLCGEPGCGKTATMKLFANKIATNEYPEFEKAEIYKLDVTNLASNTSFIGQLNTKIYHFKQFIQSRKNAGIEKVVIVIDEIHQLSGIGVTNRNTNDVWQMIKEELAEEPSPFLILGTTTEKEYDENIASDAALASRLTKIRFPSLSEDAKKELIKFRANQLDEHYKLNLSNEDSSKLIEKASTRSSSTNLRDLLQSLKYVYSKYNLDIKITPLKCAV